MTSPSTCFTPRATIASANSASTFSGAPSCSASFSKGNLRLERFGSPAPASTRSPLTRPSGDTSPVVCTVVVKEVRTKRGQRSEEHTSELQSRLHLVCRLLLEKKKKKTKKTNDS